MLKEQVVEEVVAEVMAEGLETVEVLVESEGYTHVLNLPLIAQQIPTVHIVPVVVQQIIITVSFQTCRVFISEASCNLN